MTSRAWPPYFGHTIFCDEIRQEVSRKHILIGVYDSTMILYQPLTYVHKSIAMRITYSEAFDVESHDVEFRIIGPNEPEPISVHTVSAEKIENVKRGARELSELEDNDGEKRVTFTFNWHASPFIIAKEGRLKVRGFRNGEVLPMGTLAIVVDEKVKKEAQKQESDETAD